MASFSYAQLSEAAREVVVTAADVALGEGSGCVLPQHLEAAVSGAPRTEDPTDEAGRIPFDMSTKAILERAHDAAVSAGETVELQHLREAL